MQNKKTWFGFSEDGSIRASCITGVPAGADRQIRPDRAA